MSQDSICHQIDKILLLSDRKKLEEENSLAVGYKTQNRLLSVKLKGYSVTKSTFINDHKHILKSKTAWKSKSNLYRNKSYYNICSAAWNPSDCSCLQVVSFKIVSYQVRTELRVKMAYLWLRFRRTRKLWWKIHHIKSNYSDFIG